MLMLVLSVVAWERGKKKEIICLVCQEGLTFARDVGEEPLGPRRFFGRLDDLGRLGKNETALWKFDMR